jgi:LacI family transcriptional regulator
MATIKSVADMAGVSIASVSRVINGTVARGDTEERVWKAIKELGYQPNSAARALKVRKSEQICLSFDDLGNPAYVMMTQGVRRAITQSDYRLVLSSAFSSVDEIVKHLETMGRGFADGLIISPIYSDARITKLLSELQIPVVLVGTLPKGVDVDNVWIDSAAGVRTAVGHLKSIGRTNLGFINGPFTTNPGKKRVAAFEKAVIENEMKFTQASIIQADAFSTEAGYKAACSANLTLFDAIVCANDQIAAGLMKFCQEKKITIPKDLAVVGIDNTDLASLLSPALTSIDLHAERRGVLAAELMLERLANPKLPTRKISVEPTLVVRASTEAL